MGKCTTLIAILANRHCFWMFLLYIIDETHKINKKYIISSKFSLVETQ